MKHIAILAMLLLLTAAKPPGGANDPLAFQPFTENFYTVVEQQPGVTNPTVGTSAPCVWDVDDTLHYAANGILDPGAAAIKDGCLIADGSAIAHLFAVSTQADSPNLIVSVTVGSLTATAVPVPNGTGYLYKACVVSPNYNGTNPIEGSNGGVGEVRAVQWRVESQHPRTLRGVTASARTVVNNSLSRAQYCP
jgi:hypothetical protein